MDLYKIKYNMSTYRLELFPIDPSLRLVYTNQHIDCPLNAGFDLYLPEDVTFSSPGQTILVGLGIKVRLVNVNNNQNVHYWLVPRSSIYKYNVQMVNSVGVIDKSYRGELKVPLISTHMTESSYPQQLPHGMRLFQIVSPDMGDIIEVRVVDQLPETLRGEKGFGSSGM